MKSHNSEYQVNMTLHRSCVDYTHGYQSECADNYTSVMKAIMKVYFNVTRLISQDV